MWPPASLEKSVASAKVLTAETINRTLAQSLLDVYNDSAVQKTLSDVGYKLSLPGGPDGNFESVTKVTLTGLAYFVEHLLEYCDESYTPTEEDKLRNRIKTTGIIEVGQTGTSLRLLLNRASSTTRDKIFQSLTLVVKGARDESGSIALLELMPSFI